MDVLAFCPSVPHVPTSLRVFSGLTLKETSCAQSLFQSQLLGKPKLRLCYWRNRGALPPKLGQDQCDHTYWPSPLMGHEGKIPWDGVSWGRDITTMSSTLVFL